MEEVLIPLGLFTMVVAIVALNVIGSASRRKAVLETVREAVRSGQQLSPETIKALGVQEKPKGGDLKAGAILIAIAAALIVLGVAIGTVEGDNQVVTIMVAVSAFPGFIGVVLMLFGLFSRKKDQD
ncbi:MAG: hypothetical protein CMH90_04110 [Oceanicaulis sp.]|uniref:DUF6249 domain-containing protein n=1 Tax=Oceanicaulis TaxID=153232 RepID=UPI0003B64632|nr:MULTISPECIES: DUF6249 domain-containing protein [Oceanicaulis]MAP48647.1 hypothetical protein [Oceanicaulis sp.]VXC60226.1 conserved membrane hypothetical protein [Oceanicaulis sp. 350]|tara:strand:- start:6988 stop:7365 length:378 start_codon:yes stop_codon:yes gene_type:complete